MCYKSGWGSWTIHFWEKQPKFLVKMTVKNPKNKWFSEYVHYIKNRRQRFSKQASKVLTHKFWSHEDVWGTQKITLHQKSIFFGGQKWRMGKITCKWVKNTVWKLQSYFSEQPTNSLRSFCVQNKFKYVVTRPLSQIFDLTLWHFFSLASIWK